MHYYPCHVDKAYKSLFTPQVRRRWVPCRKPVVFEPGYRYCTVPEVDQHFTTLIGHSGHIILGLNSKTVHVQPPPTSCMASEASRLQSVPKSLDGIDLITSLRVPFPKNDLRGYRYEISSSFLFFQSETSLLNKPIKSGLSIINSGFCLLHRTTAFCTNQEDHPWSYLIDSRWTK